MHKRKLNTCYEIKNFNCEAWLYKMTMNYFINAQKVIKYMITLK